MKLERSNEPVVWLLFGAGGMVAALLCPAVLIMLILSGSFSDAFQYERIIAMSSSWLGRLIWLVLIALPAWHALHRIFHLSKDLQTGHKKLSFALSYGLAAVISAATIVLVLSL